MNKYYNLKSIGSGFLIVSGILLSATLTVAQEVNLKSDRDSSELKIAQFGNSPLSSRDCSDKSLIGRYANSPYDPLRANDPINLELRRQQLVQQAGDFFRSGQISFGFKDYNRAIDCFTTAIIIHSELGEAYYYRGSSYKALGNTSSARSDWQKAASLFQQQGKIELYNSATKKLEEL